MKYCSLFFSLLILISCKNNTSKTASTPTEGKALSITEAEGFKLTDYESYILLEVSNPWPNADKAFTYVLTRDEAQLPDDLSYDERIPIPVKDIVVTSTTHIPALESLQQTNSLVGFPNLDYISSPKTRKRINAGAVKELGQNESINTEIVLDLQPDVVIGFAIEGGNKSFETLQRSGIPLVFNGDWTENHPLGKAEWIKFFGAFYDQLNTADSIYQHIKKEYQQAKQLAAKTDNQPTVLSGAMYKDVWYLPYGNSWQAEFIADANADYLYADTSGSGSISASFESVFDKAKEADFWISPGAFTTYDGMLQASEHYQKFNAFQEQNMYSFAGVTGETGGVLYYEMAPQRPDLVLKDLIHIFHPHTLPNYQPTFFKPLQ